MIPNKDKVDVTEALPSFYLPFAGYVLQTRAIPDSRDGLKTGARFILYAQKKDKLTYDKKKRKGVATVNAGMRFNPHGDASIFGNAVRMSQPFSLRYPVIDVQGNNGSMIHGDDYSASRYIEMCSNRIADEMTSLLDKNTIDKWKLNYTQEEEYPTVLPTKFPFSLVNGSTGIGVAASSSIPCFNLREVCDVLLKAVDDRNLPFEELYCPVDFPTGGIVINEDEIKESLKNGRGKSVLIRAKIEYDDDKKELAVKELPYQVFTATIAKQLQAAIDEKTIGGIESFFDGTDFNGVNIKIKLSKGANPERVCRQLYKSTSLQHHYSVNMMMLDNGIKPRLFTWPEMVYAYIDHLETVMRKGFEFDHNKAWERANILNGYMIALARIEEIVETIKTSQNSAQALSRLMDNFELNEKQAKAILELKLQRLVNMEAMKIKKELEDINAELDRLGKILSDDLSFNSEVKKEIKRIKETYGDDRRTKVINLEQTEDEDTPVEEKMLIINLTNKGNLIINETSTLMTQKRGGKGSKVKLDKDEQIIQTISESNKNYIFAFSNKGKVYCVSMADFMPNTKINCNGLIELEQNEKIDFITTINRNNDKNYIIFVTKNGMIKKTKISEYNTKRKTGVIALKLKEGDELTGICMVYEKDKVAMVSKNGRIVVLDSGEINDVGRSAIGVIGMKLDKNDEVIGVKKFPNEQGMIVTITKNGYFKGTNIEELTVSSRGTKGIFIHKLKEEDELRDFVFTNEKTKNLIVMSNNSVIKISTTEVKETSRNTNGVAAIKLLTNSYVTGIIGEEG